MPKVLHCIPVVRLSGRRLLKKRDFQTMTFGTKVCAECDLDCGTYHCALSRRSKQLSDAYSLMCRGPPVTARCARLIKHAVWKDESILSLFSLKVVRL